MIIKEYLIIKLMYENSWLCFVFLLFFLFNIQSVNIQNSLCGSRERHDVEKEKRKKKEKKGKRPADESLRLAGRRQQTKKKEKKSTNEFN